MLADFLAAIDTDVIGSGLDSRGNDVDNLELIEVNEAIRCPSVEIIGEELRSHMAAMKQIL